MKRMANKKINIKPENGGHSFLFWLTIPLVMIWLTVGYITGFFKDKPSWSNAADKVNSSQTVIPYFEKYGSLVNDLDQPFITFWFDDAWLSQYLSAYPVLKNNDFSGVIAVPINSIETKNYMNWAQLQVLQKDGWEISDHSLSHDCKMQSWNKEKISYELRTSKFILWKNKLSANIFVTPCGVDSALMREEAAKNFIGYRTVDPGYNDPENVDFYNLKVRNINSAVTLDEITSWIDRAKETNSWEILVFHEIGQTESAWNEEKFSTDLDDFIKIVQYVKSSEIKVVVPSQIIISQNK